MALSILKEFTIKSIEKMILKSPNDIMIRDDDMLSQLLRIKQDYYSVLKCAK